MNSSIVYVLVVGVSENVFSEQQTLLGYKFLVWPTKEKAIVPDVWLVAFDKLCELPPDNQKPVIVVCEPHQEFMALANHQLADVLVTSQLSKERLAFSLKNSIRNTPKQRRLNHFLEKNWFKMVVQNASDLIMILDLRGHVLYASPSITKILGYQPTQVLGHNAFAYLHPDDVSSIHSLFSKRQLDKTKSVSSEFRCVSLEEKWIDLEAIATNLLHEPLVEGVVLNIRDITERKKVVMELRQSESRFANLVESLSDLVWETDLNGTILYMSPAVEDLLGYTNTELMGKPTSYLMKPEENSRLQTFLADKKEKKLSFSYFLVEHIHKNGSVISVELSGTPITNIYGKVTGYQGIIHDVTQRQHAEQMIRNSLREKEILIKEIHHRVKNNMQIISSLLQLQSNQIQDKAILELYQDSQMRIKSMALVHEKLYQSPDLSRIEFTSYIRSLVHVLAGSLRTQNITLKVDASSEEIYLNIDIAIPCGLILNELISNCYKYAFPDKRNGVISVSFSHDSAQGSFVLKVQDNGIGFSGNQTASSSLGFNLVIALASQINGRLENINDEGAVFILSFRDKNKAQNTKT